MYNPPQVTSVNSDAFIPINNFLRELQISDGTTVSGELEKYIAYSNTQCGFSKPLTPRYLVLKSTYHVLTADDDDSRIREGTVDLIQTDLGTFREYTQALGSEVQYAWKNPIDWAQNNDFYTAFHRALAREIAIDNCMIFKVVGDPDPEALLENLCDKDAEELSHYILFEKMADVSDYEIGHYVSFKVEKIRKTPSEHSTDENQSDDDDDDGNQADEEYFYLSPDKDDDEDDE